MPGNFIVTVEEFAEKHFIKSFQKKYKAAWDVTLRSIVAELERIDSLLETDRAETITCVGDIKIIKTKFRVAGTKQAAKTSGNRCIVKMCEEAQTVSILLVYNKTDLAGKNETSAWKEVIRENYPDLKIYYNRPSQRPVTRKDA